MYSLRTKVMSLHSRRANFIKGPIGDPFIHSIECQVTLSWLALSARILSAILARFEKVICDKYLRGNLELGTLENYQVF